MICDDIADFRAALPPMQAIAGLDLGEKTIGVAVSDTFLSVATPLETVRRKKFTLDADRLLQIIAARRLGGLILGLPRT
ncbi:MAG: Holliday junction resolvase RuvX, partial [Lutimaribacter sp.]